MKTSSWVGSSVYRVGCQSAANGLCPGNTVIVHHHRTVLQSSRPTTESHSHCCLDSRLMITWSLPGSIFYPPVFYLPVSESSLKTWSLLSSKSISDIPYHSGYSALLPGPVFSVPYIFLPSTPITLPSFTPFLRHWNPCYFLNTHHKFLITIFHHIPLHLSFS